MPPETALDPGRPVTFQWTVDPGCLDPGQSPESRGTECRQTGAKKEKEKEVANLHLLLIKGPTKENRKIIG